MELSDFIGQPIMAALEKVKRLSSIVEYSKVESDEFVKVPELGFYLQAKNNTGIISAYRVYIESSQPYYPAQEELKGDYSNLVNIGDVIKRFGEPVQDIPSIKIPGGNRNLPGKKFIYKNLKVWTSPKTLDTP